MSRIGKKPVEVPENVKVTIAEKSLLVEGPKGKLSLDAPQGVSLENKDSKVYVSRVSDTKQFRSNHGTVRSLVANMIKGVTEGYKKDLEIKGVGFRAQIQDKKLVISLGFSHPVEFSIPDSVKVSVAKPTEIAVEGIDKAAVGEVAAKIRKLKPPEPYKGKGIRYVGEVVRRKQGKSVTK